MANEQDRPDVLTRRQAWFHNQIDLDPDRPVFIDETWAKTNMGRTHGRCRRGERLAHGLAQQPPEDHHLRRCADDARHDRALLPPDSLDFDPIENAFAKLKAPLRNAAERTVDGLWTAIGRIIDLFSPAECANSFSACGYQPDRWDAALSGFPPR